MSNQQSDHVAVFDEGVAYFIYSFNSKHKFDIRKFSDKLLKADVAETVVSPSGGEVRVSPRFKGLIRLLRQNSALMDLNSAIAQQRTWRWMLRHPFMGIRIISRASHASPNKTSTGWRYRRLARSLRQNSDHIMRSVAESQVANAIQHEIERDLLRPDYLESEPYLRLKLRPSRVWLTTMNDGVKRTRGSFRQGISAEVLLLVHRSGVLQLVFAMALPDQINVDDYRQFTHGISPVIAAFSIAEPILGGIASENPGMKLKGSRGEEISEGTHWRRFEFSEPACITDLFEIYRAAISRFGKKCDDEFMCYPAFFIDSVSCCPSKDEFLRNHSTELQNAVIRSHDVDRLRSESLDSVFPPDTSLLRDSSLHVNMASCFEIRWPGSRRGDFAQHLQRLLILETALLQHWQIRALARRINEALHTTRQIRPIQHEAIFGLQEYRYSAVVHGTAMEMIDSLLADWRADKYYTHVLETLDQLQQLATTEESNRSARRANFLASIFLIATIFMGLPTVKGTLDIAQSVPRKGVSGILADPFRQLAQMGDRGTWIGYLILLAIVALAVVTFGISNVFPRRKQKRITPGVAWPSGTVEITRERIN